MCIRGVSEPSTQEAEPFLASDILEFDDPVPSYEAKDVARTRADLNLIQRAGRFSLNSGDMGSRQKRSIRRRQTSLERQFPHPLWDK